jgi:hypothetical protein
MKRFGRWIRANAEPVLALAIAVTFGLLGVLDVIGPETGIVNAAVLLVLALLSATLLRDRSSVDRALGNIATVRAVSGPELSEAFAAARRDTDRWVFKGGAGTSVRAVDLPRCVEIARQEARPLRVQIDVLDPTDEVLCAEYARFRGLGDAATDGTWTAERVRKEVCATILAACSYRQRYRNVLTIEVAVSRTMSTLRWDLAKNFVIVTPEDGSGSSLVFDSGRSHYRVLDRELVAGFNQARRVPLDRADEVRLGDPPTTEDVRRLFASIGLDLPAAFSERDVVEIVGLTVPSRAIR